MAAAPGCSCVQVRPRRSSGRGPGSSRLLSFASASRGWVARETVSDNPQWALLSTADGGRTWSPVGDGGGPLLAIRLWPGGQGLAVSAAADGRHTVIGWCQLLPDLLDTPGQPSFVPPQSGWRRLPLGPPRPAGEELTPYARVGSAGHGESSRASCGKPLALLQRDQQPPAPLASPSRGWPLRHQAAGHPSAEVKAARPARGSA